MRTPGHDEELALGFALSEGLRPRRRAAARTTSPRTRSSSTRRASTPAGSRAASTRRRPAASAARARSRRSRSRRRASTERAAVSASLIAGLPDRLRAAQAGVRGRPAACTRPACSTRDGELLCLREDVGRHNAMDKVIGWAFGAGLLPLARSRPLRQRPALVRARAEGRRRRLPGARRRRRAVVARGRARTRPRRDALRLRPRRPR